ncbi:tetratricopeptide repeat protein [Nostoc sp. CHAB 5784]|uniref:CHAT domain-containing protein n=1 Tax=Nostoc mirabile TaxID=2907820 RepID=UPI001E5DBFF5|nr:CHAT domain-containing protein [Nostoc mirabile]MCC5667881.1 tetratricopeptide repeat protein [Nostoc mirabile CHAB5784]
MPNPSVASLLEQGHNQLDRGEYQAALQIFQQAAVLEPQNPQVSYGLGLTCYHLEQYHESIEYLNQALRIKPNYILALVWRGLAYQKIDQAQQAQADLDRAIALTPQDSEDWQGRGIALNELQRYEEAIESYDKAIKFKPDFDWAWNNRGIALSNLGRNEEAIESYDKAIEFKPDFDWAWYNRGSALWNLGRYEEAIESYDKAIEFKPDFDWAWYNRGVALSNLGRNEEAIESYDKAIEFKPDFDWAWHNRGVALSNLGRYKKAGQTHLKYKNPLIAGVLAFLKLACFFVNILVQQGFQKLGAFALYEEAIASFDQALKFKPDFDEAWYNRGIMLGYLGRYEEAIESYDKAIEFKPDFDEAWYNRGIVLVSLRRYEEAVASFDQALKFKPDDDWAWLVRGMMLGNLERYEEALAFSDQALKTKPDLDWIWFFYRGIVLGNLERYEEAVASFEQAIKLKPDFDWAWYNKGYALSNLGRYEAAVASYDQGLKFKPDDNNAWYYRGIVLGNWGRDEEAIASYDKAIELKPDKHEALVNKGNVLVKLKRDTEAIEFYNRALNCIDPQWWEAWNDNQGLASISALNKQAAVKTSVHKLTPGARGSSSKLYPEKLKQLQDYIMQLPSLFSDLSQAKKSYEEAFKFLTFDKFPEEHLQVLQELLKVYSLDNSEEFQRKLEEGTQLLEKLLREPKLEQKRIELDSKFAAFNQMRVDNLAQSNVLEKHIEALEIAETRKNTCLAWLKKGSIYQPPTKFGFEQTKKLLNPKTAAIYWHLSPIAITTFIIKDNEHNEPLKILSPQLPRESQQGSRSHLYQLQRFERWMQQWKKSYQDYCNVSDTDKETTPWRKNMKSRLKTLGEILQIKRIVQENLQDVDNLILIPHRELHLLPLDYLFNEKDFIITYLPSFQIGLQLLEWTSNSENTDSQKLLNIETPLKDFPFTQIQSAALYHLYRWYGKLPDPPETKTNLLEALKKYEGYFHFTGHGYHSFENPTESALELTDKEKLTLGNIFECLELDLRKYQLICLSACETGVTSQEFSKERIIDEYVGLVSGFLAKGANHVVSSLWRVDERSTALLIIRFYQLLKQRQTPTIALRQAKDWLRQSTYKDLAKWYRDLAMELNESESGQFLNTEAENMEEYDTKKKESTEPPELPYAHPYYWASFILTGKPSTTG